jgi:RNA 3'-terminal phosphate cyclase (ATP)
MDVLTIDGGQGEGGGQVLRTTLALALATGTAVRIDGIRRKRKQPGLQRHHLGCVHAAQAVGQADVEGATVGSTALSFRPHGVRTGEHAFAAGGGGSATLVLQTVLPALLRAAAPSTLRLGGSTHDASAPTADYAARTLLPVLAQMGAQVELSVLRHGFGLGSGGALAVRIAAGTQLTPCELLVRTAPQRLRARALVSQLPDDIGRRQLVELLQRFGAARLHPEQTYLERIDADGAGNALLLEMPMQQHCEIVTAFGERGVPPEHAADVVATEALALLAADVPVGAYLADQLLLPMALAGGGAFRTVEPTLHCTTNAALIERFLPVRFAMREEQAGSGRWRVDCAPR